jgi:predicted HAD superfamily phosphohydrolase
MAHDEARADTLRVAHEAAVAARKDVVEALDDLLADEEPSELRRLAKQLRMVEGFDGPGGLAQKVAVLALAVEAWGAAGEAYRDELAR